MVEYSKVNVKLPDTQPKKAKNSCKSKTGTALRISLKILMETIYHINCYWQQDQK